MEDCVIHFYSLVLMLLANKSQRKNATNLLAVNKNRDAFKKAFFDNTMILLAVPIILLKFST